MVPSAGKIFLLQAPHIANAQETRGLTGLDLVRACGPYFGVPG